MKLCPSTLSALCVAALVACGIGFAASMNGCSLLDDREYNWAQRGPINRAATTAANTAPAVATVANSSAATAAALSPAVPAAAAVAAPAALVGQVAGNIAPEIHARLDAIDARVLELQTSGIKVTRGQVEIETLVALIGAIAAAFGFGRYQHAASNGAKPAPATAPAGANGGAT
jgi:hypothetical protein